MALTVDGAVAADKHRSSAARERAEQRITPILRSNLADAVSSPGCREPEVPLHAPSGRWVRQRRAETSVPGTPLDHGHADVIFE